MASYKDANEKMNNTGAGLDGFEFSSFQEYIVKQVCRFYFVLDPVLKDRPNVYPWATNESDRLTSTTEHDIAVSTILLSSDDDSIESMIPPEVPLTKKTINTSPVEIDLVLDDSDDDEYESASNLSAKTTSSLSNTDSSKSVRINNNRKDPPQTDNKNKMTPLEAKNKQKQLLSKRKRTILKKNGKGKNTILASLDQEEKDIMAKNRNVKMNFEMQRHNDMKTLESEKIALDKARFEMERDNMELKKEHISVQTNLEKSKIILLRLEMFKKRQEIKKEYSEVTDEFLNEHFPYPK